MKLNRRRGATLGLVAVCVFVIILLAVGFFILAKIIGGQREAANATDAGVLVVARNAMSPSIVGVNLSSLGNDTHDFIGLDDNITGLGAAPGNSRISMQNINRLVAQSVLVALNAQSIDTPDAAGNARRVAQATRDVATELRNRLHNASTLNNEFTRVAHSNNTKMWAGQKVNLVGNIESSFMRPGFSTNVFFHGDTQTEVNLPSTLLNSNANAATSTTDGSRYMAGYTPWSISVGHGPPVEVAGVPIFPRTQPHIVDVGEFDAATTDQVPGAYLPPNAFKATSQATEGTTGHVGGSLACAIVGVLDRDFPAAIPRGYVRINNGEDANAQNTPIVDPVVDGTQDIFNNELWAPNSISVATPGTTSPGAGNTMFTRGNELDAWVTWNNDSAATAATMPSPAGIFVVINQAPGFRAATVDELADNTYHSDVSQTPGVMGLTQCNTQNGWGQNACLFDPNGITNPDGTPRHGNMPSAAAQAYGRFSAVNNTANPDGYTNIEYMKASVLQQRANGAECARVDPPTQASGMKRFNVRGCFNTSPGNPSPAFGAVDTPKAYLDQISDGGANQCATDVVGLIANRMSQVDHGIDRQMVENALNNSSMPLAMGQTLVLYSPGPGLVTMTPINPGTYFRAADANLSDNDGRSSTQVIPCENTYRIDGTVLNSTNGAGAGGDVCTIGDANYHASPFTELRNAPNGEVRAVDRAVWTPASGFNNLLGDLKFENTALNGGSFCKPN